MKFLWIFLIVIIFGIIFFPNVSAQSIPQWVKTNAGWWSEGSLEDQTFVNGIHFLIKEQIIPVSYMLPGNNSQESVPLWVKNLAGWWVGEKISDIEFLESIQYLVKKGIMKIDLDNSKEMVNGFSSINEIDAADANLTESESLLLYDELFPFISGYRGATFDGQFVYFAPYYNNYGRHGIVLQYDTTQPFDNPTSWDVMLVPGSGFQGVLYTNDFVILVPYFVGENKPGGKIIVYDTSKKFQDVTSWGAIPQHYDIYEDGVAVGNHLYFSPHLDFKNEMNTFPLHIDTTNPQKWIFERMDLEIHASFIGAAFDGQKIYYAPWSNSDYDGTDIMIYDTKKPFLEKNSWEFISIPYMGYSGAGFNGTHIVFAPCYCSTHSNTSESGRIMFLNVNTQEITYSKSEHGAYNGVVEADGTMYLVADINQNGIRSDFVKITNSIERFSPSIATGGYWGGTFDRRYVYYAPYDGINYEKRNSEFLRYDTNKPFDDDASWETISFRLTDFKPFNFGNPNFIND